MTTIIRRHPMVRALAITGGVLALILVLGIVMLISMSNWNGVRPWLNRTVSATTERPFAIHGDLELHWVRKVASLNYRFPRPQISASDIEIGNPDWAQNKQFATVRSAKMVFDPLLLFRGALAFPLIEIDNAQVALERRLDGENTWTFGHKNDQPSRWRFAPGAVRIRNSTLQLDDAARKLSVQIAADSDARGILWRVRGALNKAPLQGHGLAGSLLALQDTHTPYPLDFFLEVGGTRIDASGTLTNPSQLAALDMKLKLSGDSMAHLYALTNIVLPETPAFATEGRLVGTLNELGGAWRYEKFTGRVGDSDLEGTIMYEARAERPLLRAELVSQSLDFKDLAPLIGADSNENKIRRGADVLQPDDKVLPVEPFKTDRWRSIDAHVKFNGKKIIRDKALPIDNLHAVVDLNNGVLMLHPLNFGIAGGTLQSNITFDSTKQPVHANMRILPRGLKLKELFPTSESMQASLGEVNGSAALTGNGDSIAALLGNSNGEVKLYIDRGTISKFILEAAGLNIANVVVTKLFGDKQVALNCGAANFKVEQGVMQTQGFIVDTDAALINVDGDIALNDEKLALTMKPQSKGLRLLSLRAPLYVNGTFKKPDVSIDKGVLALRGGGAIALGAVAWPAGLIPLVQTGTNESASGPEADSGLAPDNGCVALLSEAKEKAVSVRP